VNTESWNTGLSAPGGLLARERERRGWGVADTAERLHLEPRVVEAIEANQFGKLGPAVFAKGHLKQYALLLGLPVEQVLDAYRQWVSATSPPAQPTEESLRTSLPMSSRGPTAATGDDTGTPFPSMAPVSMSAARWARFPGWALSAIVGSLLLMIALGVLLWLKPWSRVSAQLAGDSQGAGLAATLEQPPTPLVPIMDQPSSGALPAVSGGVLATTGTMPPVSAPVSAAPAAAREPSTDVQAPGTGRLRLRLSFTSDSWVEVRDASGAMVFRGKGAANSVRMMSGSAPLQVYLGAVSGVQLEINRQAVVIGPQFVRGDVARFEAGADGVLRRVPRP